MPPGYEYEKIECSMQGVRDYLKFIKRGFSRATHLTSIDIRNERMTRDEAKALIEAARGPAAGQPRRVPRVRRHERRRSSSSIAMSHQVSPYVHDPATVRPGEPLAGPGAAGIARSMIAIVDYGMGNLRSVAKALEAIGEEPRITSSPEDLRAASHIILPGVGAFGQCAANLRATGLVEALDRGSARAAASRSSASASACSCSSSAATKAARTAGSGWFDGMVRRFEADAGSQGPAHGLERRGGRRATRRCSRACATACSTSSTATSSTSRIARWCRRPATTASPFRRGDRRRQHLGRAVPSREEPAERSAGCCRTSSHGADDPQSQADSVTAPAQRPHGEGRPVRRLSRRRPSGDHRQGLRRAGRRRIVVPRHRRVGRGAAAAARRGLANGRRMFHAADGRRRRAQRGRCAGVAAGGRRQGGDQFTGRAAARADSRRGGQVSAASAWSSRST